MKETDTVSELNRYRQAADVAYRYAKNKLEQDKQSSSGQKEEDVFKADNKEEVR